MGWFGPRGLASIVLGLVYLEQEKHLPGEQVTRLAVMATVLLSIFAHGLSAQPGIRCLPGNPPKPRNTMSYDDWPDNTMENRQPMVRKTIRGHWLH